jgi:hypothetical protein
MTGKIDKSFSQVHMSCPHKHTDISAAVKYKIWVSKKNIYAKLCAVDQELSRWHASMLTQ